MIYIVPYVIGNIDAGVFPSEIEKIEYNNAKLFLELIKKSILR